MPSRYVTTLSLYCVLLCVTACGEDTQPRKPWKPIEEMQDARLPDLGRQDAAPDDAAGTQEDMEPDLSGPLEDAGDTEIVYPSPGSVTYSSGLPGCDTPACSKEFQFGVRLGVMSRYQQKTLVRRYDLNAQDAQRLKDVVTDEFIAIMQSKEGWVCQGDELTASDERITVVLRMNLSPVASDTFLHDVSLCYHNEVPLTLGTFLEFAQDMSVRYGL